VDLIGKSRSSCEDNTDVVQRIKLYKCFTWGSQECVQFRASMLTLLNLMAPVSGSGYGTILKDGS
jgi:hypothetical protein